MNKSKFCEEVQEFERTASLFEIRTAQRKQFSLLNDYDEIALMIKQTSYAFGEKSFNCQHDLKNDLKVNARASRDYYMTVRH
jgi:hypothetical protein